MLNFLNNNTNYTYSKYTHKLKHLLKLVQLNKKDNKTCKFNVLNSPSNNLNQNTETQIVTSNQTDYAPMYESNAHQGVLTFDSSSYLCRIDKHSFVNLRSYYRNLLDALKFCWIAMKNNKRILFVHDHYILNMLNGFNINPLMLQQYTRVCLPRLLNTLELNRLDSARMQKSKPVKQRRELKKIEVFSARKQKYVRNLTPVQIPAQTLNVGEFLEFLKQQLTTSWNSAILDVSGIMSKPKLKPNKVLEKTVLKSKAFQLKNWKLKPSVLKAPVSMFHSKKPETQQIQNVNLKNKSRRTPALTAACALLQIGVRLKATQFKPNVKPLHAAPTSKNDTHIDTDLIIPEFKNPVHLMYNAKVNTWGLIVHSRYCAQAMAPHTRRIFTNNVSNFKQAHNIIQTNLKSAREFAQLNTNTSELKDFKNLNHISPNDLYADSQQKNKTQHQEWAHAELRIHPKINLMCSRSEQANTLSSAYIWSNKAQLQNAHNYAKSINKTNTIPSPSLSVPFKLNFFDTLTEKASVVLKQQTHFKNSNMLIHKRLTRRDTFYDYSALKTKYNSLAGTAAATKTHEKTQNSVSFWKLIKDKLRKPTLRTLIVNLWTMRFKKARTPNAYITNKTIKKTSDFKKEHINQKNFINVHGLIHKTYNQLGSTCVKTGQKNITKQIDFNVSKTTGFNKIATTMFKTKPFKSNTKRNSSKTKNPTHSSLNRNLKAVTHLYTHNFKLNAALDVVDTTYSKNPISKKRLSYKVNHYYDFLQKVNKQSHIQNVVTNPWSSYADIMFFVNPEHNLEAVNAAKSLGMITIGITSGSVEEFPGRVPFSKKNSHGLVDTVYLPLMGNNASPFFITRLIKTLTTFLSKK